jgi:hypothetical protein
MVFEPAAGGRLSTRRREAYVDAEGLLEHLTSVGPMMQEPLTIADLTRLEVHGPATELDKLKDRLTPLIA